MNFPTFDKDGFSKFLAAHFDRELEMDRAAPPALVETLGANNIVRFQLKYFVIPHALGPVEIEKDDVAGKPGVLIESSLVDARAALVGRLVEAVENRERKIAQLEGAVSQRETNVSMLEKVVARLESDLVVSRNQITAIQSSRAYRFAVAVRRLAVFKI
jgi:hypothetical protein